MTHNTLDDLCPHSLNTRAGPRQQGGEQTVSSLWPLGARESGGRKDHEQMTFFFNVDHFLKAFIELVTISLLFYVFFVFFFTTRHVES